MSDVLLELVNEDALELRWIEILKRDSLTFLGQHLESIWGVERIVVNKYSAYLTIAPHIINASHLEAFVCAVTDVFNRLREIDSTPSFEIVVLK